MMVPDYALIGEIMLMSLRLQKRSTAGEEDGRDV